MLQLWQWEQWYPEQWDLGQPWMACLRPPELQSTNYLPNKQQFDKCLLPLKFLLCPWAWTIRYHQHWHPLLLSICQFILIRASGFDTHRANASKHFNKPRIYAAASAERAKCICCRILIFQGMTGLHSHKNSYACLILAQRAMLVNLFAKIAKQYVYYNRIRFLMQGFLI